MNWLGEVVYLVSCRRGRPGPEITSLVPAQAAASGYHLHCCVWWGQWLA